MRLEALNKTLAPLDDFKAILSDRLEVSRPAKQLQPLPSRTSVCKQWSVSICGPLPIHLSLFCCCVLCVGQRVVAGQAVNRSMNENLELAQQHLQSIMAEMNNQGHA